MVFTVAVPWVGEKVGSRFARTRPGSLRCCCGACLAFARTGITLSRLHAHDEFRGAKACEAVLAGAWSWTGRLRTRLIAESEGVCRLRSSAAPYRKLANGTRYLSIVWNQRR